MAGETIQLSTGGPHSPQYTRAVAAAVAEAVRVLNHATFTYSAPGLAVPADADAVIGSLTAAAERLPQLLDQLGHWLAAQHAGGSVEVAYGPHAGDPSAAVLDAGERLQAAAANAAELGSALKRAAQVTATLSPAEQDTPDADGEPDAGAS